MFKTKTIDSATARALAVEASTDPRSIVKAAAGEPVKGLAGQRAKIVLLKHGYEIADADDDS